MFYFIFFFFSSRRRHTRLVSDWSSDVCSSDLEPFLVLGAPGATYITMGNLQVMLNVIDFGMTAEQAVYAPRFTAVSDTIEVSNRILRSVERDLLRQGYRVMRHAQSYTFASVHAIRMLDGKLDGGADPATGGLVVAV